MSDPAHLGQEGEDIAAEYLKKKGYRILKRNWKSGRLEIDIIAETTDTVVFIEVKTRSEDFLEDPKTAINRNKQKSMEYAAENYLKWNNVDKESRFDVITVIKKEKEHKIDHIEDAFYPTLR